MQFDVESKNKTSYLVLLFVDLVSDSPTWFLKERKHTTTSK